MEGIAFSRDTAVIMTGVFVNEEEVAVGGDADVIVTVMQICGAKTSR